jgi:hypothetical protein
MTYPEWKSNIRPAPPGTAIRYGNIKTGPVEEISHIGFYALSIIPNRYRTALDCVHDIVSAVTSSPTSHTTRPLSATSAAHTHYAYPAFPTPKNGAFHSTYSNDLPNSAQPTPYTTDGYTLPNNPPIENYYLYPRGPSQ